MDGYSCPHCRGSRVTQTSALVCHGGMPCAHLGQHHADNFRGVDFDVFVPEIAQHHVPNDGHFIKHEKSAKNPTHEQSGCITRALIHTPMPILRSMHTSRRFHRANEDFKHGCKEVPRDLSRSTSHSSTRAALRASRCLLWALGALGSYDEPKQFESGRRV